MKQNGLLDYISTLNEQVKSDFSKYYKKEKAIPWWWGFVLFLLGFGLLWMDERLFS
jgi:hypothetical protein